MPMNHLVRTVPSSLPSVCNIWKTAVRIEPGLSEHISLSALDTRIWLAEDALCEWAMGIVRSADVKSWDLLSSDPRLLRKDIRTEHGDFLLHLATRVRDYSTLADRLALVVRLLESGVSPSLVNDNRQTPLHDWNWYHTTSLDEDSDILEELVRVCIQAGLNINSTDSEGRNVLHANVKAGKSRQLKAILDAADRTEVNMGLRATAVNGCTPLMEALAQGSDRCVDVLLQFCSDMYGWSDEQSSMGPRLKDLANRGPSLGGLVDGLLDSGLCARLGERSSPHHLLGPWASLDSVKQASQVVVSAELRNHEQPTFAFGQLHVGVLQRHDFQNRSRLCLNYPRTSHFGR